MLVSGKARNIDEVNTRGITRGNTLGLWFFISLCIASVGLFLGNRYEFNFSKAYKKFYGVPPKSAKREKAGSDKA